MKKNSILFVFLSLGITVSQAATDGKDSTKNEHKKNIVKPDADNAGLKMQKGFGALIVADNLGRPRHLVVTPSGEIYIKAEKLNNGNGVLLLQDKDGDGKAETIGGFGKFTGTGIAIKKGYLYATSDDALYRYKLDEKFHVIAPNAPETIIKGLLKGQHAAKPFALDDIGNIFINIGANSNSCQVIDRTNGSKGMKPCPILDSAGGIWQFKADKLNQTYKDGIRYATGLRNVMGIEWNNERNSLFVTQHGRDQLYQNWPQYYDSIAGAELPSECFYELKKGADCGWPYIYYNHLLHKKMLAPEYGGDGKKEGDAKFLEPTAAYPGHMAPDGILFYTGSMFPERYKHGVFITFHGSWNRAPLPQKGYFIVFQPLKNGKPISDWKIFADGFSGKDVVMSPREAIHKPCGLAQGPDGSLYVSDDSKGTIYRIIYQGK